MTAFRYTPMSGTAPRALTVNLTRYTAKPVLVANVEEARYDVLLTQEGKRLVRGRSAVRNNQRAFLAVSLPSTATLWSATLAGQAVRPGLAPSGALLVPLRKGRANEEAPVFVVEIVFLDRGEEFKDKQDVQVTLPALDLPISRTGLTIYHSPLYSIEPQPGSFRIGSDTGPWTPAMNVAAPTPPPPPPAPAASPAQPARDAKVVIDQFRQEAGRVRQGIVPVAIEFPAIGPSMFLESELTAEAQSPSVALRVRENGGGR